LNKELHEKFTAEFYYQADAIKKGNERIQALEDRCAKERADRVQSLKDQLDKIQA